MALPKCTVPDNVIGSLANRPYEMGMSAQELKDKFDEMPEGIKKYLNEELVPALDEHLAENVTQGDNPHGLIYEEGTWTPVLSFGGNSDGITYSFQIGRYRRINNIVFCDMTVQLTNKGTSTGQAVISGLPYSAGGIVRVINIAEFANITLPQGGIDVAAELSLSQLRLISNRSGTFPVNITDANFTNTTRIRIYFTYFIN